MTINAVRFRLNIASASRIAITAIFFIQSAISFGQDSDILENNRSKTEKHEVFFYGAVCDFVEVRLYQLINLVSGKSAGVFISEKQTNDANNNKYYSYKSSYNEYFTIVNFFKSSSGEILLIDGYISGANIQTDDKDAIHLLSRLGIKPNTRSGIVQVKCEATYLEIEYSERKLIGIYLFTGDRIIRGVK